MTEKIKCEKARQILAKNGMEITPGQANAILEWITKLADIAIRIYLAEVPNTPNGLELVHSFDEQELVS